MDRLCGVKPVKLLLGVLKNIIHTFQMQAIIAHEDNHI